MTVQGITSRINNVFKPKPTIKENAKDAAIYGLAAAALTGPAAGFTQKSANKSILKQDIVSIKNQIKSARQENLGQEVIKGLKNTLKGLKKQTNSNVLKAAGLAALSGIGLGIFVAFAKKAMYNDVQRMLNNKSMQKPADEQ